MSAGLADRLPVLADLVRRFGLASLAPALRACEALAAADAPSTWPSSASSSRANRPC